MKKTGILKFLLFVISFSYCANSYSQSARDLRINEVLSINENNFVDDYGHRSGWIEIFNSAYNSVDIGGLYLTNDPNNPKKYWIPKGDPRTLIAPRNYVVFFADNLPTHGIFHLNFTIDSSNYIALYDANGRTLVDSMRYFNMMPDISYGRETDGAESWVFLHKTTPLANNFTGIVVSAGDIFKQHDPYGAGMAVVAMSVVFLALILLFTVFKNIKPLYSLNLKNLFKKDKKQVVTGHLTKKVDEISGEVNAAIAMALYLHTSQFHDYEETILTIKKVTRIYSPWSSKIYGMRNSLR